VRTPPTCSRSLLPHYVHLCMSLGCLPLRRQTSHWSDLTGSCIPRAAAVNCIFFISGEHGKSVPNANDTSAVCAKKLTELAAYNMTNQAIGLYGSRVGATLTSGPKQDYSLETAAQAVAVFSA
jgi:hypothetical protein